MTTPPINLYTLDTANQAAKVRVYIGNNDGSGSEWEEVFDLIPLEVMRVAGSRPDYALFELRHDILSEGVGATYVAKVTGDQKTGLNRQVYLQLTDVHDSENNTTLFWGELLTETLQIDPNTDRITLAARVADYHFGDLLEGEYQYDLSTNTVVLVPIDPEFNPLVDGIVEGNLAGTVVPGGPVYTADEFQFWVDPESVRTEESQTILGEAFSEVDGEIIPGKRIHGLEWSLQEASLALCHWLIGATPEFIEPPSPPITFVGTIWQDAPEIKNVRMMRGVHLPRLLDDLLTPNGYDWYVSHQAFVVDELLGSLPKIEIFRRGKGVDRVLQLQPVGEELDLAKSNTMELRIQADIGNLANEMRGWGSFEQKELTIPLFRGWPESQDSYDAEDLRKSGEPNNYSELNATETWRLFVANEAGDYNDTRETVQPITAHLDLSGVFDLAIPRRRIVEDCLTLDANGKRRIPYLQWSADDGSTWSEVPPEWGWVILPDQIGVMFTGDIPPEDIIAAGDDAKLRITCTITGDQRLNSTSSPIIDESPNSRVVPLFLDLSDRYHKRSVQTEGSLQSALKNDPHGADEADDASDFQSYLADQLEHELYAEVACDFRLHGLHAQFEISDLIVDIRDRGIAVDRDKQDGSVKQPGKFVQIFGIRYLIQEQVTELIVESFD